MGLALTWMTSLGLPSSSLRSVALEEQIVEVAEDGAQVLAGGDGAPAADGMEAHSDRALGQQRRRLVGDDAVGMVDAEDKEVDAVGGGLAVFARAAGGGELVGADDVLGAEVARAQAVAAAEEARHLGERDRGQAADALHGLRKCGANVAAQRIVAGERFVGALQNDDVLLALERVHDGGLGEGADDVDMDGADATNRRASGAGNRPRLRCFPRPSRARRRPCRHRRFCIR